MISRASALIPDISPLTEEFMVHPEKRDLSQTKELLPLDRVFRRDPAKLICETHEEKSVLFHTGFSQVIHR
jgi:hypothetical protein